MSTKNEPWYVHAVLYVIIAVLSYMLIKVAIIEPREIAAVQRYNKQEARLRMTNLREAQILWQSKHGNFTDNLDSLINFLKNDPLVDSVITGVDSITNRASNPFDTLLSGLLDFDSFRIAPKTRLPFIINVDTNKVYDTVINRSGKIIRIDSTITIGTLYEIISPDNEKDRIGDKNNEAMKNTASWE